MAIKNPKGILLAVADVPRTIEERLPAQAPKLSETLTSVANSLPDLPDFPVELPDLPAAGQLPDIGMLRRRPIVTDVEVTPIGGSPSITTQRRLGAEIMS